MQRFLRTSICLGISVGASAVGCHYPTTIAFESNRAGNQQIYAMNSDGTNFRRVTNDSAINVQPGVSPAGLKIAYSSRASNYAPADIYTIFSNGQTPTQLTFQMNTRAPRWSPGGSDITFSGSPLTSGGAPDIYLIRNDGTMLRRLTTDPGNDIEPSFSPDGSRIVFTSTRNGASDIYVMNVDGSNQTRLTTNASADAMGSFSPDGTKIAFWTNRDGNGEIYLMNADGAGQVNVSNSPSFEFEPVFSPDTNEISFSSTRDGNSEIYVMDLDTAQVRRLTNDPAEDRAPDWK